MPAVEPRRSRMALASMALAAPGWLIFVLQGGRGLVSPLATSAVLGVNVVLTEAAPNAKVKTVRLLQRFVINPPVRAVLQLGVLPIGLALLETTGRTSGQQRRTPVGNGRVGDSTFWIIAEHGLRANYVRNITADPRVRVKCRRGWRCVWHEGIATILFDDDPYARQRQLCRRNPIRLLNVATVRVMGAEPVTVRVDLLPRRSRRRATR